MTFVPTPEDRRSRAAQLQDRYRAVRAATEDLCRPLAIEDQVVQSMENASPIRWHRAHTTWFFETFVLADAPTSYELFDRRFRSLFNSYYNTVGPPLPRAQRGVLSRPTVSEVTAYRAHVDLSMIELLAVLDPERESDLIDRIVLGLHHEQQHQELILTDIKHAFSCNPLRPAYTDGGAAEETGTIKHGWSRVEGGLHQVGHDGRGFSFDNERPRHRVYLEPFEVALHPVTNEEYMEFIADGGYERHELWLAEGWDTARREGWRAPLYWSGTAGRRTVFTLHGTEPLRPEDPVCHVSYFEADAFARWAGARLATEEEWEVAAGSAKARGELSGDERFHPRAPRSVEPESVLQALGRVWEWTSSPYAAYPGFSPGPGAIGEYNGKFMCGQFVLRGGSSATPAGHTRPTYRNFFPPDARWQFSGIRLARDVIVQNPLRSDTPRGG